MKCILVAALLAAAAPVAAKESSAPVGKAEETQPASEKARSKASDVDMAQLFAMFDKIFPPQPEPPAERLSRSRVTAAGLFPDGTYARIFDDMMSGVVDRVLTMTPADFETDPAKKAKAERTSLRDALAKDDPHFQERMTIMRRVIGEELARISALIEPKLREGLARSMARRFDETQLTDINAFLATDSGKAFGRQSMSMWVDPEIMRGMFASMPELMMAMPGAMKRVEAATAHLPKPKNPPRMRTRRSADGAAGALRLQPEPGCSD